MAKSNWYLAALATIVCLLTSPALAQTATGTGVGVANSTSRSSAVAVSGQGGNASGNGNSSVTVNGAAVPATSTLNQNVNTSGTSTIKNVPTAIAPGLAAAGLETCLGSVSGGGSFVGTGFSFGSTIPDPGCAARLDSRTLWAMGLKGAAVARLCLTPEIYRSMPDVCARYTPGAAGTYATGGAYAAVGGPIELTEGRTGLARMCDDYDSVRQRCRVWTGSRVAQHHAHHPKAKTPSKPVAALPPVITEGPPVL